MGYFDWVCKEFRAVNQSDPYYLATKKHFYDLISRFGDQIFCLNLVKVVEAQKRESILVEEYQKAIDYINKDFEEEPICIRLQNFDMKNILKKSPLTFCFPSKSI